MKENRWARLLAYMTGLINHELLLKNQYLAAENRILRAHLPTRLRLSDPERSTLAKIAKRLGRKALSQVACVAKPDTILAWYRKLITRKFDGSKHRRYPGRPPIEPKLESLIVFIWRAGRISLAGITRYPDQAWMQQMARNATGEAWGFLDQRRYALHDRDAKFCAVFRSTLAAGGIEPIQLPARSPNLNTHAERWCDQ
jgi:hypothetical protein